MHLLAAAAPVASNVSYWPFVVLVISVACIILFISVLRIHAFIALILAALIAGILAEQLPGARPRVERAGVAAAQPGLKSHWVRAVELTTEEFGVTAGKIGVVIGFAAIIGMCLMQSGAADKVVRRFLAAFGEKNAAAALLVSTYILSIPIFFDTMFMLMVPLAMALCLRTGKDYMLYIMVVCCSGVITHSMTIPHPGPLAMAESLKIDVGFATIAGIVAGIIPAAGGYYVCKWINRRVPVPVRQVPGIELEKLRETVNRPESELPGFMFSLMPVIVPIVLISLASFMDMTVRSYDKASWATSLVNMFGGISTMRGMNAVIEFIGNKNIALLIGAILSLWLLASHKRYSFAKIGDLVGPPLETAGIIILITSAGGAFGLMLKNAGVGDAIKAVAEGRDINLILLSYVVAFVLRVAQGSATVAMLTTAAMMFPLIDPSMASNAALPYNIIYIFLAIGFGAFGCSWMNDSGFWVVSKLGGLTERETLKSWTTLLTINSIIGIIVVFTFSKILPLKGL